jgi:glycosyltransferase involved in cell wall biosynthesis
MKVLHLINTLSAGGAELHLLTLCRYLNRSGVQTVVACLRERVKGSRSLRLDFESAGVRVICLETDGRYDLRCITRLMRLVGTERPTILHTHLPRADLAGVFGRLFNPTLPWICSVHDIHDKSWSGRWTLPAFNFVWSRADRVVAISHAVKDWLIEERSVPREKVMVIHYGIEPDRFRFAEHETDLRRTWNLESRDLIGAIGRLEPRKGHDCLIRAMPEIKKGFPDAMLLIAGHDPWGYGKDLQSLINTLGLHQDVRLVGFQSDIPAFLGALDVFAFATHSEGFGQVIVEAMAAAKPMVVSKVAPLTEIVVGGETGMLAEPQNPTAFAKAIKQLLTHRQESQQMGERARERVHSHFSAQRMAEETLSLYHSML